MREGTKVGTLGASFFLLRDLPQLFRYFMRLRVTRTTDLMILSKRVVIQAIVSSMEALVSLWIQGNSRRSKSDLLITAFALSGDERGFLIVLDIVFCPNFRKNFQEVKKNEENSRPNCYNLWQYAGLAWSVSGHRSTHNNVQEKRT